MPIDILGGFGKLSTSLTKSNSTFNKLFSSPIYASLILTVIILVIILFVSPAKKRKTNIMVKLAIYILMSCVIVLFLHDSALIENTKEHVMGHKNDGILDQMTSNGRASDPLSQNRVTVVPFKKKLGGEGGIKGKKNNENDEELDQSILNEKAKNIGKSGKNNDKVEPISEEPDSENPLLEEELPGGEEILYAPKFGGSRSPKFGVF